jgi:hemolysin D
LTPAGLGAAITGLLRQGVGRLDRRDEREFLPAALAVLETPPSPAGRLVGAVIIAFFVLALAWAFIGKVDVIATAPGRLAPAGRTKIIQPLDAGVVRAIHVQDGDHVRAGQVLIELDPTESGADRDRLVRDLAFARLDVARLTALQAAAETGGAPRALVAPPGADASDVAQARAALRAQVDTQAGKVANLDQEIGEKRAEESEANATIAKLNASLPLLEEKARLHSQLRKQGFGTSFADLDAQQAVIETRDDLSVEAARAAQARAAAAALRGSRAQTVGEYHADILSDLAKAQARADELSQDLIKAQQKSAETRLLAPIDGVVQDLAVHTLGGVVTPAQHLLTVVPDTRRLTVEAMLANSDIGFVHAGQDVEVKIETFNFTRYGLVRGKVTDVSRDTSGAAEPGDGAPGAGVTPPRSPSYVAHIALDRSDMVVDGQDRAFLPGMAVIAEIKTGRRTIIDYLLSPIARKGSEAMHER